VCGPFPFSFSESFRVGADLGKPPERGRDRAGREGTLARRRSPWGGSSQGLRDRGGYGTRQRSLDPPNSQRPVRGSVSPAGTGSRSSRLAANALPARDSQDFRRRVPVSIPPSGPCRRIARHPRFGAPFQASSRRSQENAWRCPEGYVRILQRAEAAAPGLGRCRAMRAGRGLPPADRDPHTGAARLLVPGTAGRSAWETAPGGR
jgi:hypothetical protein